jgi:hypothetical protein
MKRFLPLVSGILFVFLNACGNNSSEFTPTQWTAMAETLTATSRTPTWTPTPDPPENKIVEWLNEGLLKEDPPEQTLDARYLVTGVLFRPVDGSSAQIFRVDLRCECPSNTNCCFPERMFTVFMGAMKGSKDKIINKVPSNVGTIKVVCFDHTVQNYVMGADWTTVKGYLNDNISGYELGAQVYRTTYP